jgi:DNA-binding winged helix-turn-helix (wHTH) protein
MNLSFEDFTFSGDTRQLLRGDVELHLSPKAFDLLRLLLDARPKALSKGELMEHLWPATFVTDANLSVLVAEIRAALGDHPRSGRFIRTVQRYGYAFCGTTTDVRPRSPTVAAGGATCWLVSGSARTRAHERRERHRSRSQCVGLAGSSRRLAATRESRRRGRARDDSGFSIARTAPMCAANASSRKWPLLMATRFASGRRHSHYGFSRWLRPHRRSRTG